MTTEQNSGTVAPETVSTEVLQPAPGADDQKPTPPEGEAPAETQQETTEQVEAKKQSKFQRRLDRQKAARVAAETESRLLREERDRLQAKLEGQSKPKGNESAEPQRNGINPATGAEYTFEEYVEARAEWRADQKVSARFKAEREAQAGKEKQQQAQSGSEKVAKAWAERETAFQTATKDYAEVVGQFTDQGGDMQALSREARLALVESESGPALLYRLAKLADDDPEAFSKIADLSPMRQVAELGKLEVSIPVVAKKTTSAPAPASTTSGGSTSTKKLENMSQEEYEQHRKGQGARWAR